MNRDPEAPPLQIEPAQVPRPPPASNDVDFHENNAQALQAVLKLLVTVDHLYLEKDDSGPHKFLVVDNFGRRLFNVGYEQGRVFQAVGIKGKLRAVSTYALNTTNVEGHELTFEFHKTPFHLCGGRRMLGTLPLPVDVELAEGEVPPFNYEDQYYIKAVGGDSTCIPCRIKAFQVVEASSLLVVSTIGCRWPDRPGVYGINFPNPNLNPEVKLLSLVEAMTEYTYYFQKQCCGYVGERGCHCILFYIISLACLLLLVAAGIVFVFFDYFGKNKDDHRLN